MRPLVLRCCGWQIMVFCSFVCPTSTLTFRVAARQGMRSSACDCLRSARASLFELRSALGQLTSSPKQAIDVDGSAQQRQLTASSPGEIKWDGTQFVMTADLKVNGTITADTCACGAR